MDIAAIHFILFHFTCTADYIKVRLVVDSP